jgi:C4-dicarboxylate transporter, DctM subunit
MINELLGRLLSALNFVASLMICGIMLIITTDVIGRAFFRFPLYGVPEITKLSIISIVWLQMAYTLRARQHLRSNLILGALPRLGQRTVLVLNALVGIVIFSLIAYYAYPELMRAWRTGAFEGEHPVRIPVWPIWATIVLGSALTALEYAIQAVQTIAGRGEDVDLAPVPVERV